MGIVCSGSGMALGIVPVIHAPALNVICVGIVNGASANGAKVTLQTLPKRALIGA
jgi:hypothetical protein